MIVSLDKYSHEELVEMSMIELASKILFDEKKAINFRDIFSKIAEIKGFSEEEKKEKIAQFYTDLNVDGRFITLGSSMWGLKRWYPVEQAEEEIKAPAKKKTKKKKAAVTEEETEEGLDIVDEDIDEIVDGFDDPEDHVDEVFDDFDELDEDEDDNADEVDDDFDDNLDNER